jgi:hypothetical protein
MRSATRRARAPHAFARPVASPSRHQGAQAGGAPARAAAAAQRPAPAHTARHEPCPRACSNARRLARGTDARRAADEDSHRARTPVAGVNEPPNKPDFQAWCAECTTCAGGGGRVRRGAARAAARCATSLMCETPSLRGWEDSPAPPTRPPQTLPSAEVRDAHCEGVPRPRAFQAG